MVNFLLILYLSLNLNAVHFIINKNKTSILILDDYTACATGSSIVPNETTLQIKVLPQMKS